MSLSLSTAAQPDCFPQTAGELEPWRGRLQGRKFVWVLSPSWNSVWTRQNHFATRLARLGAEVLYIENPSSWCSVLRKKRFRDLPIGGRGLRVVEPGLHVMRPWLTLPGMRYSDLVAKLNGRLVSRQIKNWLCSRQWGEYVAWCRVPHSGCVLQHLHPSATIYDITDDYELFEKRPACRARIRQREKGLIASADVVLLASQDLQRRKAFAGVQNFWIPNGAEYELFAAAGKPGAVHSLVSAMPKPVIGYVGLTTEWMDFELLAKLGSRWPGHILMVGPIAPQWEKRAKSIPGLVWAGFVPQTQLPMYLRGFDVCVMPHLANELVRMSNPLKIWEYLATGKPIVSVDLPALNGVRDFVDAARDHEHFIALVENRLKTGAPQPTAAAQAAAASYSWDAIFRQLLQTLEPHLRLVLQQPLQFSYASP